LRRNAILAVSLLVIAAAAYAGTGINLYGLSWHPDRGEVEANDWREVHPGLGLQHDLMAGDRSRLSLEAGVLDDAARNLNYHGGLSYRHQAWGPLWAGAALFIAGSKSDYDGEPVGALLPLATLVTDLGELNWTYVPDADRRHDSGALLMYATLFPWGRTPAGHGRGTPHDGLRRGLEFRLDPSDGLEQFRGVAFVYRQVDPQAGGFRVGAEFYGDVLDADRWTEYPLQEAPVIEEENDLTQTALTAFYERIAFRGDARRVRAVTGLGCELGHRLETRYGSSTTGSRSSETIITWRAGIRASLGAEWRVAEDLVLTADSHMTFFYERETSKRWSVNEGVHYAANRQWEHTWGFSPLGATLGVVLYYD